MNSALLTKIRKDNKVGRHYYLNHIDVYKYLCSYYWRTFKKGGGMLCGESTNLVPWSCIVAGRDEVQKSKKREHGIILSRG